MKILLTYGLLLISVICYAQPRGGGAKGGGEKRASMPTGIVKGIILDESTKQPMEYANAILYRQRDSTMATGGITNHQGEFLLKDVTPGKYYLEVSFIGYNKRIISPIAIGRGINIADIKEHTIQPSSDVLSEVTITSEKPPVQFKLDRKIVNVHSNLMADGGTAVDVLENTPSITVDLDGNVALRGSENFTVLLDGKPSVLSGSDALNQIPASSIQHIEVITNPSAKFEPDGVSGIINIILKRNLKDSFSGITNLSAQTNGSYKGDITLNYRSKKWGISLAADYNDFTHGGSSKIYRETYIDSLSSEILHTFGDRDMNRKSYSAKLGFDYSISDKTTLVLSGKAGHFGMGFDSYSQQRNYITDFSKNAYSINTNLMERWSDYFSLDASITHQFSDFGHQLVVMGYYDKKNGGDTETQYQSFTDSLWNPNNQEAERIKTGEEDQESLGKFTLDYTLPLNQGMKFEAGYSYRNDQSDENYLFNEFDNSTNDWIENPKYESNLIFDRDIHAVYSLFAHEMPVFSYQIGLRGEYTDRSITVDKEYNIERFDLFPTLHASTSLGASIELMAGYSRRIDRPRSWYLSPFISYVDPYTVRIGNPELKPEYIDSYDITLLKRFGSSFISLETYYRKTHDKIERIQRINEDGLLELSNSNIASDESLGADLMANIKATNWLSFVASTGLYKYAITGIVDGVDISDNSFNYNASLSLDAKLTSSTRLQLSSRYFSESTSAMGTRGGAWFANAALRQTFLDDKLTATVQVRDIFGTMQRSEEVIRPDFYSSNEMSRDPRIVSFSLSFKINDFKLDRKRSSDNSMEQTIEFDY